MVLVFSSVFMGIWNSDQKAMHSAIARNKRLQKPIAVFPMPPVETVRRENLSPIEFSVPEPRPVRVAMRGSDDVGQGDPVIERHEEQSQHQTAAEVPVVTLTPISEDVPQTQNTNIEAESAAAEVSDETVVVEQAATEEMIPELAMSEPESETTAESEAVSSTDSSVEKTKTEEATAATESSVSGESAVAEPVMTQTEESVHNDEETTENKSEEVPGEMPVTEAPATDVTVPETPVVETVTQIEQDAVPAPEDFSVEVKVNASVAEVVEAETPVTTDASVMVAENLTEETVTDNSGDVSVVSEQPVTESTESELPEPADPVVEESAVHSETVAINEAESIPAESNAGDAKEEEKSFEEKLLKSGEYDMLDVHSEDVTPGTVEPALDGGATCIPLPRNLASGTWQVIHPSGEFFKITVDRGRSSSVNRGPGDEDILESSFCITAAPDGVRWCFIRSFVDSPAPVRRVTTEFFSPGQQ